MASNSEEARLRRELEAAVPGSSDAAALLSDLATLKLSEGKVEEAQELFAQVQKARDGELEALAREAAQDTSHAPAAAEGGAGSEEDDWETAWDSGTTGQQRARAQSVQQILSGTAAASGTGSTSCSTPVRTAAQGSTANLASSSSPLSLPATPSRMNAAPPPAGPCQMRNGASASAAAAAALSDSSHPHVLEVYGLTRDVSAAHLEAWLDELLGDVLPAGSTSRTCSTGSTPSTSSMSSPAGPSRRSQATGGVVKPVVRWVDDNHALLVCNNAGEAVELLALAADSAFNVRPFSRQRREAAGGSVVSESDLLPPKARPKTTTAVAKKLLAHALGNSALRDRAKEQELRATREAAKPHRREREAALEAAWGDD